MNTDGTVSDVAAVSCQSACEGAQSVSECASEAKGSEGERAIERRSACRTCRRVTVRMEETPEAKTVEVKGAEEEAMEAVPWQEVVPVEEPVDSRTSEEVRSRCSRDGAVIRSYCDG